MSTSVQQDTAQSDAADHELAPDQLIEPNTARNEVAFGNREIVQASLLPDKRFDLFRFNQRQILTRLVAAAEISFTFDARSGNHDDLLAFDLRLIVRFPNEDALKGHGCNGRPSSA